MKLDQVTIDKIHQARLNEASDPSGLSQGDIIILEDGKRMRIGHNWGDGSYQLTNSSQFFCEKNDFFLDRAVLGHVHLSSGGLNTSIDSELEYIGIEEAHCWTWKETPCAGGGTDMMMPFRLFKIK